MRKILAKLENGDLGVGDTIILPAEYEHLMGKSIRELANETTSTTITEDIPVAVAAKVLETAIAKRVMRTKIPVDNSLVNAPGSSIRWPEENTVTFAAQTEGAVSITASSIDTGPGVTVTPALYMGRVDLTYQAIEDGKHQWLERAGRRLGLDAAVFEDKLTLSSFYAGSNAAHIESKTGTYWNATSGRYQALLDDIQECMENIEVDKYAPDTIFMNTVLTRYIRDHPSFNDYSVYGAGINSQKPTNVREGGVIGAIYNMEVVTTPNAYESTSYAKADTFLIMDTTEGGIIADKRPFTVKQHDMPELDENWLIGSFRMAPAVVRDKALSGKTNCLV